MSQRGGAGRPGGGLPWPACLLIAGTALAAALCAAPALSRPQDTAWAALLPFAALYALCEWLPRCPETRGPLLLGAVFLMSPEAAALVPLAGALIGRVRPRHAAARRVWHAAQLGLAGYLAGQVQAQLTGAYGAGLAAVWLPGALLAACAAALAYCAVLSALDGAVLVAAERCSPRTAWRGLFPRGAAPHLVHGLVGLLTALLWYSPYGPVAASFVLLPMYICNWVFAQCHRERAAHQATLRALVQAVDIKDRYTRGHGERVGRASVLIGRELGLDAERAESLRFAGILHDVGKLGVPTRLLRKDGPLTPDERAVIELHPEYGHEMVRGIRFLGEARDAILHHHERLDGRGYPYGLAGAEIPEFARIVAVADAFDAMTSTRSYRRARPVAAALAELERCAGTQFDPPMVAALRRALAREGWSPAVTTDVLDLPDVADGPGVPGGHGLPDGPPPFAGSLAGPAGFPAGSAPGSPAGEESPR